MGPRERESGYYLLIWVSTLRTTCPKIVFLTKLTQAWLTTAGFQPVAFLSDVTLWHVYVVERPKHIFIFIFIIDSYINIIIDLQIYIILLIIVGVYIYF